MLVETDAATGVAAEAKAGIDDVEHRQRHRLDRRIECRRRAAEASRNARGAAGKTQGRRRKRPVRASPCQHGGRIELDRAAVDRARADNADPLGRNLRHRLQIECPPARTGERGADFATAVAQLCRAVQLGEREIAIAQPLPGHGCVNRRAARIEQHDRIKLTTPRRDHGGPGELGIARHQMRFDTLDAARHGEIERSGNAAAVQCHPPRQTAVQRLQRPRGAQARRIERGNLDHGIAIPGQQDRAVAGERPKRRYAPR